jgi:hypothetical protein
MAITIKSAPQASGYVSANEDVWHVADSTNKAVIGFKYLFDIYKGAELLTRVTNSPYGDDGYGVINVGNIVRSAVAVDTLADIDMQSTYNTSFPVLNAGADFWWGEYDVRYGEICGTTNASGTILNSASGTYRVYNTYNRHPLHRAAAALSSGTVYLTNRPNESYFYIGEPVILSFNGKRLAAGNEFDICIAGGENTVTAVDGFHYFSINGLGGDADVEIETSGTVLATKKLKKRCSKYTPYTLIFLNTYGAWDSFTFVNGNVLTDNQKKKFEQSEWKLSGFNMVNKTGKVLYEGMRTYGSEFNTKMKLTTDLLNSNEYIWLFELIVSPLVYLWDKTANLFHPVQITDSNYEIKNSLQNKTETLDINIDVYKQNTQYR